MTAAVAEVDSSPRGVVPTPLAFSPHAYQSDAFDSIWREFDGGRRSTLVTMPTGTGKTILFGMVAKAAIEERAGRVLVLAHRDELLEQAQSKLAFVGVPSAIEKADQKARRAIEDAAHSCWNRREIRCVVGSVQSMRGKRLESWPRDYFTHVVYDEAHHSIADSYQASFRHFAGAKVLGVTATPMRTDKVNLGSVYESIAYSFDLARAIAEGYLAPVEWSKAPVRIDLRQVNANSEDLNQGDLEDAIRPFVERMVRAIKANEDGTPHLGDRPAILFAPGRKSVNQAIRPCQAFADGLNKVHITAKAVWGDHPDRLAIVRAFARREFQVLCNADLLTEGYDAPFVEAVILARPTKSAGLFQQMIGRGTRLSPETGKTSVLVIDFDWQIDKHKLCNAYTLVRPEGSEDAQRIAAKLIASGEETDILKAADRADAMAEEIRVEREEQLARAKAEAERIKQEREEREARKEAGRQRVREQIEKRAVNLDVRDGRSDMQFRRFDPFAASAPILAGLGRQVRNPHARPMTPAQQRRLTECYGLSRSDVANLDYHGAEQLSAWAFKRQQQDLAPLWLTRELMSLGVPQQDALRYSRKQAFGVRSSMQAKRSG